MGSPSFMALPWEIGGVCSEFRGIASVFNVPWLHGTHVGLPWLHETAVQRRGMHVDAMGLSYSYDGAVERP